MTSDEILKTEYSEEFDNLRKKTMIMSFYKYGYLKDNANSGCTNFEKSLEMRYAKFKETRNTEYLADVANMCMMLFMYPAQFGCYYKPTDSKESPGIDGMSVQELKDYANFHELT